MQLYLDTSALVKLVIREQESDPLRDYLAQFPGDITFTSALSRTELIRAVARAGSPDFLTHATRVLRRLDLVALSNSVLDDAAALPPAELRTLDAIHLAAAKTAPTLRAVITYDVRFSAAAASLGMTVVSPA
jgi:predicted nucleic acid-binding protein